MNTIKYVAKNLTPGQEKVFGSLYRDPDDGELFILARPTRNEFVAVSLVNGNRFRDASPSSTKATEGLEFLCRGANIHLYEK